MPRACVVTLGNKIRPELLKTKQQSIRGREYDTKLERCLPSTSRTRDCIEDSGHYSRFDVLPLKNFKQEYNQITVKLLGLLSSGQKFVTQWAWTK